jgi:transcriptional regulator with XRE-family HTH domain
VKVGDDSTTRVPDGSRLGDRLGGQIHQLRRRRRYTLQQVSDRTGVSVAMLSMIERGRSNPSIGTLHAVADALGVPMSELFHGVEAPAPEEPDVLRAIRQEVMETVPGVTRRVIISDPQRGYEFVENRYVAGTASAPSPVRHGGHEFGFVLEGELEVTIAARTHLLRAGDAVRLDSSRPHRFRNPGPHLARTIWVNLQR